MTNTEIIETIQSGDKTKKTMLALWNQNQGLCFQIARRYTHIIEMDDAMQTAFIGVVIAAETFDSDSGASFTAYMAEVVKNELIRYAAKAGHSVRMPGWMYGMLGKYRRIMNETQIREGREPTQQELCERLEVSACVLERIRGAERMCKARSLSEIVGEENDGTELQDMLADRDVNIEADCIDTEFLAELRKDLEYELQKLKADQADILRERYLGDDCPTFQQIADRTGEPVKVIRDREQMAIRRLRDGSRRGRLRAYLEEIDGKREALAYRGSLGSFQRTWTSATERAALLRCDTVSHLNR